MLKSLYISSFIIIDELRVNFDEGMSVLTGETGAGKSIIIDALGQLCGNRTSTSLIKKKASKAIIEGIFDVIESEELKKICEKLHIELEEEFVITKEILSSGKSNVKINYQNASINALKLLMPYLIDIHSQFETQKLFEEKNHIILLDQYANDELKLYIHQYKDIYQKYKEISSHLNHVIEEDMSDEQLDFLQSQLNEIEESMYTDEEIEEFESELKLLQNYEKINENIQQFDFIMNSSNGVLTQMKEALHTLQILQDYEEFNESYDKMYDLGFLLYIPDL
ncbi:MAG: AAA family ATPase [Coprobacillus sp.]|nr:AAA family ATPase [Coprobacillus sp.]